MRNIVVVGAGPCGLTALKELLEEGHNVTLYEASGVLGGVFATSVAQPSLHLTASNWFMSFSDFPDPARLHYSSGQDYLQYLHAYTRHFNLEKHIRYNSPVSRASLGEDNLWSLEIHQSDDTVLKIKADALVVATGANQVPNNRAPELEGFTGRVIHSSKYDAAFRAEVKSKKLRVLVVGAGESGVDVAAELAELSPNVTVWTRKSPCFGQRYFYDPLPEMERVALNKTSDHPANDFLETFTTNRISASLNVYAYGSFRNILWNLPGGKPVLSKFNRDSTASIMFRADQATWVTKSSRVADAVALGKLEVLVRPTASASGSTCRFSHFDSKKGPSVERDFDAVVLCTGYHAAFPWLDIPEKYKFEVNPRAWFLHAIPNMLGDRLFFVGYARPHQGGIPIMAEILTRYIARLLNGKATPLPADYGAQALRDMKAEREYYNISPNLDSLVDYNSYMESLARRVGCEPQLSRGYVATFNLHMLSVLMLPLGYWIASAATMWSAAALWTATLLGFVFVDDGFLLKWWFYPSWAFWYRLNGPGAKPEVVKDVLGRMPLREGMWMNPVFIVFVLWMVPLFYLQRVVSAVMFVPFVTLRMLGLDYLSGLIDWLRPKTYVLHSCPWRLSDLFLP